MTIQQIAKNLKDLEENIILIYAFNATGKTQLSVAYKNYTKSINKEKHSGVYYNAFSEDLFIWDNDEQNDNENIRLNILISSLNQFHYLLNEIQIREKLELYKPKYDFYFNPHKNSEDGIESITFFIEGDEDTPIKISRGEERIFVWCFFLALFEVEGWVDQQNEHFFIDDPISSLDDNNVFNTAMLLLDLLEKNCNAKKIIITTHHMGLFSILQNWLSKGENAAKFKNKTTESTTVKGKNGEPEIIKVKEVLKDKYLIRFLEKKEGKFSLVGRKKGVHLYHLLLLQVLNEAIKTDDLNTYHFVLLRQLLESISSFLGNGRFSYVLDKIEITNPSHKADIINALSHENIFTQKLALLKPSQKEVFTEVYNGILNVFPFSK
ncbi:AAA family ATPase [Chryseobacterium sp.]|uniref:AAA family ATPase n=1 Tax=Chryseobacterium sp. TaxID=1871047 RepID=UPI0023F2756B|nr:AAA family ATPase [Chryseobacterium sp.]